MLHWKENIISYFINEHRRCSQANPHFLPPSLASPQIQRLPLLPGSLYRFLWEFFEVGNCKIHQCMYSHGLRNRWSKHYVLSSLYRIT